MKKKLICALMTAAMAGSLVSGLTVSADSDSQVTISLYTTLPNKDSQFEQLCEEFMEENPDIKVNYIAYDSSEKQKWMTLYASGEAPTVSLMDAVDIRENIENMAAYDLEGDDSWIKDQVDDSNLAIFKDDNGSVYGVPNSQMPTPITRLSIPNSVPQPARSSILPPSRATLIWTLCARRFRTAAFPRSCSPALTGPSVLTS